MKNILLFLFVLFTLSCLKDTSEEDFSIYRKWSVLEVEAGFSPKEKYAMNDIIWSFRKDNILAVEINVSILASRLPFKTNGSYIFEIENNLIQFQDFDIQYIFDGDSLILLKDTASDGPRIVLKSL